MENPPRQLAPMARSSKFLYSKKLLEYLYVIPLFILVQNLFKYLTFETLLDFTWQGNLGWAYMQKSNYMSAEVVYKKAQMIDPDANKACNLALCLIKQARKTEASSVLGQVLRGEIPGSQDLKAQNRAQELMLEVEPRWLPQPTKMSEFDLEEDIINGLEKLLNDWTPFSPKRLPIFEEISSYRNQVAC